MHGHLATFTNIHGIAEALVHDVVQGEPPPKQHAHLPVLGIYDIVYIEGRGTAEVCPLFSHISHIE